jgi:hypothetical protein
MQCHRFGIGDPPAHLSVADLGAICASLTGLLPPGSAAFAQRLLASAAPGPMPARCTVISSEIADALEAIAAAVGCSPCLSNLPSILAALFNGAPWDPPDSARPPASAAAPAAPAPLPGLSPADAAVLLAAIFSECQPFLSQYGRAVWESAGGAAVLLEHERALGRTAASVAAERIRLRVRAAVTAVRAGAQEIARHLGIRVEDQLSLAAIAGIPRMVRQAGKDFFPVPVPVRAGADRDGTEIGVAARAAVGEAPSRAELGRRPAAAIS